MNGLQERMYRIKANQRKDELYAELYDNHNLTQIEKDIIILEIMELSIAPYSRWWRWGYKSTLKRARLALKEKMKNESIHCD